MKSDAFKIRLKLAMRGESNHSFAARCAISEGTVRRYLKGDAFPPLDTLQVIASVADVSLGWLASGEGEMKLGGARHTANGNNIIQGSHIDAEDIHLSVKEPLAFMLYQQLKQPEEAAAKIDPVMTVIKQELQRMTLDQKRAVLKLCMDITGEQYTLIKNSSQSNREQRLKGILKEDPDVEDTEFEGWEW